MHNAMQFVLSNPVEGSEDEYNSWYSGPHTDHTLRTPGILAGQRFRRTIGPWPSGVHEFLTIWEFDDPAATLDALAKVKFTDAMPISPAVDIAGLQPPTMWHRGSVRSAARVAADSSARSTIVLMLANTTSDDEAGFERDLLAALPSLADLPGVLVAHLFTLGEEQIRGNARKYRFGVLIELWDEAALALLGPILPSLPRLDPDRWLAPVFTSLAQRQTAAMLDLAETH